MFNHVIVNMFQFDFLIILNYFVHFINMDINDDVVVFVILVV